MAGRREWRGAGGVGDAGLQQGEGGGCGPGMLASLLDLMQQLHAADRQDRALQQRPQLVGGPHARVGEGRGCGNRGRRALTSEADGGGPCQKPKLQRDEVCCRDLGRLQDRMHVIGQRPKGRNHLAGAKAVPRWLEMGGKELADGYVNLVGDFLAVDVSGSHGVAVSMGGGYSRAVYRPLKTWLRRRDARIGTWLGLHRVTRAAVRASGSLETYSSSGPPCTSDRGTCSMTFVSDGRAATVTVAVSMSPRGVHAPVTAVIA